MYNISLPRVLLFFVVAIESGAALFLTQICHLIKGVHDSEVLLVSLDASMIEAVFKPLRIAAFPRARTRYVYPVRKDDLIDVIQAGAPVTCNKQAVKQHGGYLRIRVSVLLVTASRRALYALERGMRRRCDPAPWNILDLFNVAGDKVVSAAAFRSRR